MDYNTVLVLFVLSAHAAVLSPGLYCALVEDESEETGLKLGLFLLPYLIYILTTCILTVTDNYCGIFFIIFILLNATAKNLSELRTYTATAIVALGISAMVTMFAFVFNILLFWKVR